jgi:hypothetical protein
LPYALSRCSENDALGFEAHLLACETCFQDLKTLDRAGKLIQEFLARTAGPRARDAKQATPARRAKGRSAGRLP